MNDFFIELAKRIIVLEYKVRVLEKFMTKNELLQILVPDELVREEIDKIEKGYINSLPNNDFPGKR